MNGRRTRRDRNRGAEAERDGDRRRGTGEDDGRQRVADQVGIETDQQPARHHLAHAERPSEG